MLLHTIREQMESRPKTWKRIAAFILENPTEAMTLKLRDFSEQVAASEGSVVNFARSLGYEGYVELKVAIAQDVGGFSKRYHGATPAGSVFAQIAESAKNALDETAVLLSRGAGEELASKLAALRGRVLICGRSTSGSIAEIFAGYLMRLQIPAFTCADPAIGALSLGEGDLLVAISYSGKTDEIFEAVRIASERGADTACVTAFPLSQIAKACRLCVPFTSLEAREGDFPIVARLVQLAVLDAVCSAVSARKTACGDPQPNESKNKAT